MASFKGYKRTIKLEFDYNEVKEGVPNASKQMALLNAEFRKSSVEAEASGKSIDKLGVQYDYLSNKIKLQEQKVEEYKNKLQTAKDAQGENSKAVQNNTVSLASAEAQLAKTKAELEKVSTELDKQKQTLGKTSEEWEELSEKTAKIGKELSMKVTAPIMAAAAASFKMGADYEQALGKMEVVFEDNAKSIEKWASTALKDFGLARSTAVTMASDFGALFKGMGFAAQKTEEWSKTLTERTMDLSNFYDTTVAETTTALNAIVTGQTEPLRKFGINMSQAALQEYAYANGIRKKISDMTEAEKVQLRYGYVIEKTNIAVGTTARESDSATGQMNKLGQASQELGVSFSEHILPVFTPFLNTLTNMIVGFSNLSDGTKKFIVTSLGIIASAGPLLLALSNVFKIVKGISDGLGAMPKIFKAVGKGADLLGDALDTGAYMSFVKWAAAIFLVAAAIAAVIWGLNVLLGRTKDMKMPEIPNINEVQNSIHSSGTRAYAVGTNYVDKDQLALIHEGEAVIPANQNPFNPNAKSNGLGGGDTYILQVNMSEVDEVYKLTNTFNKFKQARRAGLA